MVIHCDSSYLIDLLREQARGKSGRATAFLEDHQTDRLCVSVFVVCELEAGAANSMAPDRERARVRALLNAVDTTYPDERFAPLYAEALVTLQKSGRAVATMDLLIGTAAAVDEASLVTANRKHFESIPDLDVLDY